MVQYSAVIVDDDEKLTKLLQTYFEKEGFITGVAHEGFEAMKLIREKKPDIIILDLMLPGIDGWEICRRVRRETDIPILMLTARDEETDRLIGLEMGADDYVTKPFSPREVVARAKVILRRSKKSAAVKAEAIKIGNLSINYERHEIRKDGELVDVTPTEFKIVELLTTNPGRVYSRLHIVEFIQDYAFDGYERTIDAHIKNLRRKLEDNPKEPQYIITVYGVGYKFAGGDRDA
ncbi:response regulator [Sporomusa carbonis]|uniref:response regulator n=1 Tax=Sporomusa carbonis TaxID=3076075 RepID=UPI003C7A4199